MIIILTIIASLGLITQFLLDYFIKNKKKKLYFGLTVLIIAIVGIWGSYISQNNDNEKLSNNLEEIKKTNIQLKSTLDLRNSDLILIKSQNDSLKTLFGELTTSQKSLKEIVGRESKFNVYLNNILVKDKQVVLIPIKSQSPVIRFDIQNVGKVPAPESFACITYPKNIVGIKHDKWFTEAPPGVFIDDHIVVQKEFEHLVSISKLVIDVGNGLTLPPLEITRTIKDKLEIPLTLLVTVPNGPRTRRILNIVFYNGDGVIKTVDMK